MQRELKGNGIIVPIELFQEWFPSGLFENFFRGFIFGEGFQVSLGLRFMEVSDHSSFWHNREGRPLPMEVGGGRQERGQGQVQYGIW